MKFILYLMIILFINYIVFIFYEIFYKSRNHVKSRLEGINDLFLDPNEDNILKQPFTIRIIRPLYVKFIGFIGKITPYGISQGIEKTILYAGSPGNITVNRLMAIQIMVGIIVPGIFHLLGNLLGISIKTYSLILMGIIGFFIPLYIIRAKARTRQSSIQKTLPDMLDLLFVSVEAGLGFDMALKRTTEKMPGPLAEELNRALEEINRGRRREESLRAIVHRTGVDDLSTFISAVIQSEQLGSNIANMLRVQSSSMRQKRRQRAEELAKKVPIKMLFPLVFFMLPALFIVILGPAIIKIIHMFKDML